MVTRSQARARADRDAGQEYPVPQHPAIYLRISDDRRGDELGVARQEKRCRQLGKRARWRISEVQVYVDNDLTAARSTGGDLPERPDFDRLCADIEAGRVDGVLVYDLDRLLRDPFEAEAFWLLCERAGMMFVRSEEDDIDISNGYGLMVARIKAAVAAEEVRKIRKRVRDKKLELAEHGLPAGGGMRPFGWSCSPRTSVPRCHRRGCDHGDECRRRLAERAKPCSEPGCVHDHGRSVVPAEADALVRAAAKLVEGESYETAVGLVCELTGRRLDPATLARILTSPRIVGLRVHRGEVVGPAVWPAILDRGTWDVLRLAAADRRYVAPYREHLLSGFARCGMDGCGRVLHAQVTTRHGKKGPVVYSCRKRNGGCAKVSILASALEPAVVAEVGRWLADDDMAAAVNAVLSGGTGADVERAEAEVARHEEALAVLARQRSELELELVEWQALRAPVVEALAGARSALSAAQRQAVAVAPLGAVTVAELAAAWPEMEPKVQRRVISVLADVTVRSAGKAWRKGRADWSPVTDRVDVTPVWLTAA